MSYNYKYLPHMYAVKIPAADWKVISWKKGKRTTAIKNYCCFPFQASGTVPVGNIIANGQVLATLPSASTIWVDTNNQLGVGYLPPPNTKHSVSGFPLILDGRECSLSEALSQGWDTSPLYATSHAILGVSDNTLYYYVFNTTSQGVSATWNELLSIARMIGCSSVLLGDGGGSTILDIEGTNAVASAGNRQLATLMQF